VLGELSVGSRSLLYEGMRLGGSAASRGRLPSRGDARGGETIRGTVSGDGKALNMRVIVLGTAEVLLFWVYD